MSFKLNESVLGFAFPPEFGGKKVLLMRKARPDWQKGRLNGVGGKVNSFHAAGITDGESPASAMAREFREETGVHTSAGEWRQFAKLEGIEADGTEYICYCYEAQPDVLGWRTVDETEPVFLCDVEHVLTHMPDVLPNVRYLILLALDRTILPVTIRHRIRHQGLTAG